MNDSIYKYSRCNFGNTRRLTAKLKKGMSGELIKILFIGGSVTKGSYTDDIECYVRMVDKRLKDFNNGDFAYEVINLGEPSANSLNGRIKLEKNVVDYKPDIVFIDFAVNDSTQLYLAEAFEGMLRRILLLDNQPAVCPLIFCNNVRQSTGGMMNRVAEHYHVPVINIASAVCKAIDEGLFTWDEYAGDYVHPTFEGHEFISCCIIDYLDFLKDDDITENVLDVPLTTCFSGMYNNLSLIEWNPVENIVDKAKAGDIIYEKTINMRALIIEVIQDSIRNAASLDVKIDGLYAKTLDAFSPCAWGNAVAIPVFRSDISKKHKITIHIGHMSTINDFDFGTFIVSLGISL